MNQKQQAPEQLPKSATGKDDSPKFGRLLIVLFFAVALIVFITFATEAYYSN
ncbi:MAG: hypothetical protein Q7R66_11155 [Undibacterium sp.]|uniref:hypothetical protein n=1 Tax=Undibacterium sp. TaxID=1914977 RepID=UPI00272026D4|nr:hypothetical protein [Undibacterium sp.]MDO8652737.1 hypothetical protein [Undibacterium sp.]